MAITTVDPRLEQDDPELKPENAKVDMEWTDPVLEDTFGTEVPENLPEDNTPVDNRLAELMAEFGAPIDEDIHNPTANKSESNDGHFTEHAFAAVHNTAEGHRASRGGASVHSSDDKYGKRLQEQEKDRMNRLQAMALLTGRNLFYTGAAAIAIQNFSQAMEAVQTVEEDLRLAEARAQMSVAEHRAIMEDPTTGPEEYEASRAALIDIRADLESRQYELESAHSEVYPQVLTLVTGMQEAGVDTTGLEDGIMTYLTTSPEDRPALTDLPENVQNALADLQQTIGATSLPQVAMMCTNELSDEMIMLNFYIDPDGEPEFGLGASYREQYDEMIARQQAERAIDVAVTDAAGISVPSGSNVVAFDAMLDAATGAGAGLAANLQSDDGMVYGRTADAFYSTATGGTDNSAAADLLPPQPNQPTMDGQQPNINEPEPSLQVGGMASF